MGQEISTVGGAIATVGTSVAAGVTFGQVDALNNAVVECAKFTGDAASETIVRHVGETVGVAVATGATAVAAGVTFGQVDALNETVVDLAKHTAGAAVESGKAIGYTANGLANGIPGVGHIKGGIHYAVGDKEGGDAAMKSASRTVGVVAGGVIGSAGGPAGMVAGGIAGGAAMDGITTGFESAIEGKYVPSGQIKAWTDVAEGKDGQPVVGGVVGGLMAPAFDGLGGLFAGKGFLKAAKTPKVNAAGEAAGNVRPRFNTAEAAGNARPRFISGEAVGNARPRSISAGSAGIARSSLIASEENAVSVARGMRQMIKPKMPTPSPNSDGSIRHSDAWKTALKEAEDNVIHISKLDDVVLYRGINRGENPYLPGGHGAEVGEGLYFTDDLEKAIECATTQREPQHQAVQGEVYEYHYRAVDGHEYIKLVKEHYSGGIDEDDFLIIKTQQGAGHQYRFSPHSAEALEQNNALKLRSQHN